MCVCGGGVLAVFLCKQGRVGSARRRYGATSRRRTWLNVNARGHSEDGATRCIVNAAALHFCLNVNRQVSTVCSRIAAQPECEVLGLRVYVLKKGEEKKRGLLRGNRPALKDDCKIC